MRRARRWMRGGLLGGAIGFVLLCVDQALGGPINGFDTTVNAWVTQWRATGFPTHALGEAMSMPGDRITTTVAVVGAAIWMAHHKERALAVWCIGIGSAAAAVVTGIKYLAQRPRPPVFGELMQTYSFPSGHTIGATAAMGAVLVLSAEAYLRAHPKPARRIPWFWARVLAVWILLALVAGTGRVLAQEHWLTDVLASWLLGLSLVSGILFALSYRAQGGDPGPTAPEPAEVEADKAEAAA